MSSKRASVGFRQSFSKSFKAIKDRKGKTRNLSIKNDSHKSSKSRGDSSFKKMNYNKTINFSLAKLKHKRTSTALAGESFDPSRSISTFMKKSKNMKKERHKLNKEIMRRLKMRSINTSGTEMQRFSIEKSRKSQFDMYSTSQDRFKPIEEVKERKYKKIPLPISSTSKRLKKAIKARLR